MNSTLDYNLLFGRCVPPSGTVNLAYIEIPPITPDEMVLIAAGNRFANSNRGQYSISILGQDVDVIQTIVNGADFGDSASLNYSHFRSPDTDLIPVGVPFDLVSQEISVLGVVEDETGGWYPKVRDGLAVRSYTIPANENPDSWVLSAGWTTGDTVNLIYTIPEIVTLSPRLTASSYDGKSLCYIYREKAPLLTSNIIQLSNTGIYSIVSIEVHSPSSTGSVFYTYEGTEVPASGTSTGIVSISPALGQVSLARSFSDDDQILVTYRYHEFDYHYQGYWDSSLGWISLDLNPQPGHVYHDPDTGALTSTSGLPGYIIYLYLLPSAAYSVGDAWPGTSGYTGANLNIVSSQSSGFYSCLRHAVVARSYSATGEVSTYGFAHYGNNHYSSSIGGIYLGGTDQWPCAMLLAKFYVGTNASVDNVRVIDTRSRGGGLPDGFDMNLLDYRGRLAVSTYWDMSSYSGDPVALDGNVVFEIPESSVSGNYLTKQQVEDKISKYIAAGIRPSLRFF